MRSEFLRRRLVALAGQARKLQAKPGQTAIQGR
jgi:hypothetical protein